MSTHPPDDVQRRPPPRPRPQPGARRGPTRPEYVRVRPPGPQGVRWLRVFGLLAAVAALVGAVFIVWVMRQVDPPGEPGEQVALVEIPTGSGVAGIGAVLEESGVIANATVFEWYVRLRGAGDGWEAGEYVTFRENSSMGDAIDVLDAGPVPPDSTAVTIPPGVRLVDALVTIDDAFPDVTLEQLQAALTSGRVTSPYLPDGVTNWEGLLAPDTYEFEDEATAEEILQTLADQMAQVLDSLEYDKALALAGRSPYELVTIASLIEREAGAPDDEGPKISRVISNRLDEGMPLGIDATILYGLGRTSGELTRDDLETDTAYNSRIRAGLPPTPIALPGRDALEAAMQPAEGDWLYYVLVSNDPPTHEFTDSYDEFLEARDRAREEGVF